MLRNNLRDRLLLKIIEPLITEWIKPTPILKPDSSRNRYKDFAKHAWEYVDAIIEEMNK